MNKIDLKAVMQTNARAIALVADGCTGSRRTQWEAHLSVHDDAVSAIFNLIEAAKMAAADLPELCQSSECLHAALARCEVQS